MSDKNVQLLIESWAKVLKHADLPTIKDSHKLKTTAQLLQNTKDALRESASLMEGNGVAQNGLGTVGSAFDPVLISLVRRNAPNLIAYDIAGVQAMNAPTGLIFAMQPKYRPNDTQSESDAWVTGVAGNNQIDTAFSGTGTRPTGTGMATTTGEGAITAEMGFDITRTSVTAVTRQLKAGYTLELAQDLKAVHGLDAETELASILSTEILAEQNREVINTVNAAAQSGSAFDLVTNADGRWAVEKFKSLVFKIETEANAIAKRTRRGKGNFIICSSNVASALAASGQMDYAPALSTKLEVDDTGNTFAGVLNGRLKVYVDPYALTDYITVGFRGSHPYDAGLFYCPYVPLQMVRAVDPTTFQPAIAFKTRYGLVANPFAASPHNSNSGLTGNTNPYYRTFAVSNINVGEQNT